MQIVITPSPLRATAGTGENPGPFSVSFTIHWEELHGKAWFIEGWDTNLRLSDGRIGIQSVSAGPVGTSQGFQVKERGRGSITTTEQYARSVSTSNDPSGTLELTVHYRDTAGARGEVAVTSPVVR